MAYTLSGLQSRVQERIRDTSYSTSEITNLLNDTQRDIFNEYRLPFMEASQDYTLDTSTSDITNGSGLPSNYVQAISLYLTTSGYEKKLPFKDIREVDEHYPDPDDTTKHPANVPEFWYYFAETIRVYPKPLSAYTATLRYYKEPTALSSASDVPDLPSEFEELLVLGASYRALQIKDNYDQAGILQNKYDEILQKLVMRYNRPQVGTAARMRINRYALGKTHF